MTKFLASVGSVEEAVTAFNFKADIVDLKNPIEGALGAVSDATIREIVTLLKGRVTLSATIGDLPFESEIITEAVNAMSLTGVDFIKVGLFPGRVDPLVTLSHLTELNHVEVSLIAVLFADQTIDISLLPALLAAGFKGVMIDTMDKTLGSVRHLMTDVQIGQFIEACRSQNLMTGIAGSLRSDDIKDLLPYKPDYLGFRGALCKNAARTSEIDPIKVQRIRHLIGPF